MKLADVKAIVAGRHGDHFEVLGIHEVKNRWLARISRPGADAVEVLDFEGKSVGHLANQHFRGFFAGSLDISQKLIPIYRCTDPSRTWGVVDAYALGPVLGPLDDYLSAEGEHLNLVDPLGAHPITHVGFSGVSFTISAPNTSHVSVVGDFNGRRHIMRKRLGSGLHETFIPGIGPNALYGVELLDADGRLLQPKLLRLRRGDAARHCFPCRRFSGLDVERRRLARRAS